MNRINLYLKTALFFMLPIVNATETAISGGITSTYQTSNDNNIENELTLSADLIFDWKFAQDEFYVYFEANSSPKNKGVSSWLPEANADAGSALDKDRSGRIQVSELAYRRLIDDSQTITMGLVDVSGHFDQSRIASDENSQFLGVSFVQNPTIEFPDYTLGVVYENLLDEHLVFRAAIASSNGLADNPNLSYSQLVDINSDNKGYFSIASLTRDSESWLFKGGIWMNTAEHETFDATKTDESNYGAFMLAGFQSGLHGTNLRIGISNDDISLAQNFIGLSYQYKATPWVFGAGAAKIFLSDQVVSATLKDTLQYETYLRYRFNPSFFVTLDLQNLQNSHFNDSSPLISDAQTLLGLRATYLLE